MKRNKTGELKIFHEIWQERDHVSQISGEPLLPQSHPQWHWQFMHCVAKAKSEKLRLDKRNIILATVEEHRMYDQTGETKDLPEWKWVHDLHDELKSEDHATISNRITYKRLKL